MKRFKAWAIAASMSGSVVAQPYPAKSIRMVVGFAPGGVQAAKILLE